jgi:enoyl-CoA hydratase
MPLNSPSASQRETDMTSEPRVLLSEPLAGVRVLELNRPEKLNAFDLAMVESLRDAAYAAADDRGCRVVILTGAGRAFSAGLDIAEATSRRAENPGPVTRLRTQEAFASLVNTVRTLPQVTLAAVNGPAVGVAFALALACDIRVAGPGASFHVGAIRRGLSAGESGISYLLPRLIGAGRAFEMMLTGRPIESDEAALIGLVSRVDADPLHAATVITEQILQNSPFGVAQTKRLMWASLELTNFNTALELENRTQALVSMSSETTEAMQAFLEKRPPVYGPGV